MGCGEKRSRSSGGAEPSTGGTVVIVVPADFATLLPPYATSVQSKMVAGLLFDRLAEIGDRMNTRGDAGFAPELADRWSWSSDSLSIAFHLDPRLRWHDGVPVSSRDVRFTFQMDRDSTVGTEIRTQIARIDSVTTPDSLTAVFWFHKRYPEQFFDATYQNAHLSRASPWQHPARGAAERRFWSSSGWHGAFPIRVVDPGIVARDYRRYDECAWAGAARSGGFFRRSGRDDRDHTGVLGRSRHLRDPSRGEFPGTWSAS